MVPNKCAKVACVTLILVLGKTCPNLCYIVKLCSKHFGRYIDSSTSYFAVKPRFSEFYGMLEVGVCTGT